MLTPVFLTLPVLPIEGGSSDSVLGLSHVYLRIRGFGSPRASVAVRNSMAGSAVFRIPISTHTSASDFLHLSYAGPGQIFDYEESEEIRISVNLPDGSPLRYRDADTVPPFRPNARLQAGVGFYIESVKGR